MVLLLNLDSKRTLSVYFLSEDELPPPSGKLSPEDLDHWFGGLQQYECSVTSVDDSALSQANFRNRAGKLRRDLEQKVGANYNAAANFVLTGFLGEEKTSDSSMSDKGWSRAEGGWSP